ncbi:L,D-transpeptidase family protein [Dysgonomonas sp. OttesenSCG-928-D17]|nr:L,D-transpeptidase family protein [Dysgonomonas sp. OttesenSCG-928-D17]
MKYLLRLLCALAITAVASASCKKGPSTVGDSDKKEVALSKFAQNYPDFNPEVLNDLLKSQTMNDSLLQPFYASEEYKPVWVHDTLDTKSLYEFFEILEDVGAHGLPSHMFSYAHIKSVTDSVDSGLYQNQNPDTLYSKICFIEEASTKAALQYITGMKYGFLNPRSLYAKDYDIVISKPDSAFYKDMYNSIKEDALAAIISSQPTDSVYLNLQKEYRLFAKADTSAYKKITAGNATYKLGDRNKHISEIAERLIYTGEYAPDSLSADTLHSRLNDKLLAAINTFRKRNSYPEEKEVGKTTIDALNRPVSYYRNKIRANMERYRWQQPKARHKKHIEVNVAPAMLVATQADSQPLMMRVCVGTKTNKTPLLQSNISYLNLNPVWNIPKSIAQNEVAVLQKKDSTYMRRRNMRLYKGGKEVDASTINWSTVNPSSFSYTIRQDPGYGNSLGLIKFMFKNSHSVYLHDTPSKSAFNRKNRAVSHGCVRVQKPFDLAFFCVSPSSDLYKDQLLYTANQNPVTEKGKKMMKENSLKKIADIINLAEDNKISLSIDYYTAYMYPNDDLLYYADDIYGYDDIILQALDTQQKVQNKEDK